MKEKGRQPYLISFKHCKHRENHSGFFPLPNQFISLCIYFSVCARSLPLDWSYLQYFFEQEKKTDSMR